MRHAYLPPRDLDGVLEAFPHLRQSRLGDFDSCPLMARFALEGYEFSTAAQARGTIFHRFAAEVLRTLRRTGETMIPVEEALVILRAVAAQREVPAGEVVHVPLREQRLLRIAAIKFASENQFNMSRLIDVERRLYARVHYPETAPCGACDGSGHVPDGGGGYGPARCGECGGSGRRATGATVERVITGQPDALIADPPDGAVVLDWKTTLQPPPRYTGSQAETDAGVSYLGYFQQRTYALLVMRNYPAVARVTLREFYPLAGEARTATVHAAQLEHVEAELSALAELFDRALEGGHGSPLWRPQPGRHCAYCPRPQACPIEADVRVSHGGITSHAQAKRAAAEYVVAGNVRGNLHEALKSWVEVYGPVPVRSSKGRYEVRWKSNKTGGGKTFGVHVPAGSDKTPDDPGLAAAFAEAADRRKGDRVTSGGSVR